MGNCNGNFILDECGICNGDNTTCLGCDGILNSGINFDECGICGGNGIPEDACDCDGNTLDCEGTCGGNAEYDECGICNDDLTDDCDSCQLSWYELWIDNFDDEINIQTPSGNLNFEILEVKHI